MKRCARAVRHTKKKTNIIASEHKASGIHMRDEESWDGAMKDNEEALLFLHYIMLEARFFNCCRFDNGQVRGEEFA